MSPSISGSSYLTVPFDFKLPIPTTYCLTAMIYSVTLSLTTSSLEPTHPLLDSHLVPPLNDPSLICSMQTLKPATDGMGVAAPRTLENTDRPASSAGRKTKRKATEHLKEVREQSELGMLSWKCPKWTQGFFWVCNGSSHTPSASFTEIVEPLPNMPTSELHNPIPSTIASHPQLFKIITPVNVDQFKQLLSSHPNQLLVPSFVVDSVKASGHFFKNGFSDPTKEQEGQDWQG